MKITIKQTKEVEREIELPLFFKTENKVTAFYDGLQISGFMLGGHVSIMKHRIYENELDTCLGYHGQISEGEFKETFNSYLEALKAYENVLQGV